MGDTDNTPYGGGTWASRAAGIGGEAAWQAGKALRQNVLSVAGSILQAKPESMDIRNGVVVDRESGTERMPLHELARICYFRPDTLPAGIQAELVATRHYVPRAYAFAFTNGVQASYLEVDTDSGFVKLLKHWCVEDCGTVINPQLVDEQVRGGVVQGIGAALFEQCLYDDRGQMLNGNMADYLVPMAMEMPDIEVGHVVTPTADSELGAKGAGEAGTAGAPGCVMNAINDALRPLGAAPLTDMPFTPGKILKALGKSISQFMFTATKDKALLTTTTGALPRPSWYTANLRGMPLSQGFSQLAYREQHFDCLACHVADQHRAGIDIYVDGDTRLDDDVAGRSWVSYATERMSGIGKPRVEVPPAGFMKDKGPGDIMWEVIETRMTPPVEGKIDRAWLELDRAYKAIAPMTDKPVKIGSISAQILALMLTDQHYNDRLQLLFDMSAALNREYHALADAGAPIVQVEEPAIHQVIGDPNAADQDRTNGSRHSTRR